LLPQEQLHDHTRLAHTPQQQQQQDQQQQLQVCVSRAEDPPGFQVLVTLPGCCLEDVRIKAWDDGRLLLRTALQQPAATTAAAAAGNVHGAFADPAAAAAGVQPDAGPEMHPAGVSNTVWSDVQVIEKVVQLPGRIAANTARALMTHHGQLYVRMNDA
jgi:hypothetical protein